MFQRFDTRKLQHDEDVSIATARRVEHIVCLLLLKSGGHVFIAIKAFALPPCGCQNCFEENLCRQSSLSTYIPVKQDTRGQGTETNHYAVD